MNQAMHPDLPNVPDRITHRVVGPRLNRHGMNVWTVHMIGPNGSTGRQIGPPEGFMMESEAMAFADDAANGRHRIFMGPHKFELKKV